MSLPTTPTRGVLFVHSARSALCAHVEWAVAGVLETLPTRLGARSPPSRAPTVLSCRGRRPRASALLASALRGWEQLRFEVTEEPTASSEGARYSYTPSLGIFHALTGCTATF